MLEYVLLMNINDEPEHAREIGALLQPRKDHVMLNVIPWNPTYNPRLKKQFRAPGMDRAIVFQQIVLKDYGVSCTIRENLGQDIDAACGQMAINQDIEDIQIGKRKARSKSIRPSSSSALDTGTRISVGVNLASAFAFAFAIFVALVVRLCCCNKVNSNK